MLFAGYLLWTTWCRKYLSALADLPMDRVYIFMLITPWALWFELTVLKNCQNLTFLSPDKGLFELKHSFVSLKMQRVYLIYERWAFGSLFWCLFMKQQLASSLGHFMYILDIKSLSLFEDMICTLLLSVRSQRVGPQMLIIFTIHPLIVKNVISSQLSRAQSEDFK